MKVMKGSAGEEDCQKVFTIIFRAKLDVPSRCDFGRFMATEIASC